jgi:hypothetical protein
LTVKWAGREFDNSPQTSVLVKNEVYLRYPCMSSRRVQELRCHTGLMTTSQMKAGVEQRNVVYCGCTSHLRTSQHSAIKYRIIEKDGRDFKPL